MHNILKHAKAENAFVQLSYRPGELDVTVEDDGIGIPKNVKSTGMGIKSVKDRTNALHGKLDIQSTGKGTTVLIEFEQP